MAWTALDLEEGLAGRAREAAGLQAHLAELRTRLADTELRTKTANEEELRTKTANGEELRTKIADAEGRLASERSRVLDVEERSRGLEARLIMERRRGGALTERMAEMVTDLEGIGGEMGEMLMHLNEEIGRGWRREEAMKGAVTALATRQS